MREDIRDGFNNARMSKHNRCNVVSAAGHWKTDHRDVIGHHKVELRPTSHEISHFCCLTIQKIHNQSVHVLASLRGNAQQSAKILEGSALASQALGEDRKVLPFTHSPAGVCASCPYSESGVSSKQFEKRHDLSIADDYESFTRRQKEQPDKGGSPDSQEEYADWLLRIRRESRNDTEHKRQERRH